MKNYSRRLISLMLVFLISLFLISPANLQMLLSPAAVAAVSPQDCKVEATVKPSTFKKMPLRFEINRGQTDSQVRFLARAADSTLFLTASEAVLYLPKFEAPPEQPTRKARKTKFAESAKLIESATIRLRPVGGKAKTR